MIERKNTNQTEVRHNYLMSQVFMVHSSSESRAPQWPGPGRCRASARTNSGWTTWRKPGVCERLLSLCHRESSPARKRFFCVVVGLWRTWASAEGGQSRSYAASSSRSGFFRGRSLSETEADSQTYKRQRGGVRNYNGTHSGHTVTSTHW